MFRGTTILAVKGEDGVAIAGDGQITFGESTVMKGTARKLRRLHNGTIIAGFAGAVADAFTLFERFELKMEAARGNMTRAAIDLAQEWRQDKYLRQLNALLLVSDGDTILMVSGTGEVIEPEDGVCSIGSGGMYAMAAARALKKHSNLSPEEIAVEGLHIAADICVYTNHNVIMEYAKKRG